MSDTPRCDAREFAAIELKPSSRVVYASFARQLETELADKDRQLAEARGEVERLALEIENQRYTITCASEENQQLKESLAEARAEINIIEHDANLLIGDIKAELERKDKLIEQTREALEYDRIALLIMVEQKLINPDGITLKTNKAALSAADGDE